MQPSHVSNYFPAPRDKLVIAGKHYTNTRCEVNLIEILSPTDMEAPGAYKVVHSKFAISVGGPNMALQVMFIIDPDTRTISSITLNGSDDMISNTRANFGTTTMSIHDIIEIGRILMSTYGSYHHVFWNIRQFLIQLLGLICESPPDITGLPSQEDLQRYGFAFYVPRLSSNEKKIIEGILPSIQQDSDKEISKILTIPSPPYPMCEIV